VPTNSLVWLELAALLVVGVVLAGLGPKGGKPVGRTRLMKVARVVLIAGIIFCGPLGLFPHYGPEWKDLAFRLRVPPSVARIDEQA
jgi:hypothetical protein